GDTLDDAKYQCLKQAGIHAAYCTFCARKSRTEAQKSGCASVLLWPASCNTILRFDPPQASNRRSPCAGGITSSRSAIRQSNGGWSAGASTTESKRCLSSRSTGKYQ